jgi:phospholipid/cholesterol/gamma-HCH transport system permease protein
MRPEAIGRALIEFVRDGAGWWQLLLAAAREWRALANQPVRLVLYKQIYFTGIEALGAIGFIAALSGIVVTTEVASVAGSEHTLTAKVMIWVVVRELGPLLTAIVIIARSSSATASELATMSIRGELDSLRGMGISPYAYLIVPRLVGITLAVVAVTFYFQFIAVIVGYVFTVLARGTPLLTLLGGVVSLLTLTEAGVSIAKAFVFGVVIATTSCYFGMRARGTVTAVPRAATGAVIRNLLAVFFLDGLITYVAFF